MVKQKMVAFQRNKRENLKEKALTYLGGKKCNRCKNDSLHYAAYDFHHFKGGKESNLSKMFGGSHKWIEIETELNKCVVLCANCHRETHTYKEKNLQS